MDRKLHYQLELTPEQMIHLVNTFNTGYDYFKKAQEVAHLREDATRMKIADDIMENLDIVLDQLEEVMNNPEEFKGGNKIMSNFYEEHHLDAEDLSTLLYFVRLAIKSEDMKEFHNMPEAEIMHETIMVELKCLEHRLGILYGHEVEVYHNG